MKSKKKPTKKRDTKSVKCVDCGNDIVVSKWASMVQVCPDCQSTKEVEVDEKQPAKNPALDKLIHAQSVLGNLGFIITSGGRYYKQYAEGDAVIKIEPLFDRGTSFDVDHVMSGLMISRQEFVPVTDTYVLGKLPKVAQLDIETLLRELEVKIAGHADPIHIDTVTCHGCGKKVSDWIQMTKSGEYLCIEKCAPARKPVNA
jgi:ribosomal protein S27E